MKNVARSIIIFLCAGQAVAADSQVYNREYCLDISSDENIYENGLKVYHSNASGSIFTNIDGSKINIHFNGKCIYREDSCFIEMDYGKYIFIGKNIYIIERNFGSPKSFPEFFFISPSYLNYGLNAISRVYQIRNESIAGYYFIFSLAEHDSISNSVRKCFEDH